MARVNFTKEQDCFLRDNIHKCYTLYDLTELFNEQFPEHFTNVCNLQKRLSKLGLRKGTHNIRKDKIPSKNSVETVIVDKYGRKARVKIENGYIQADSINAGYASLEDFETVLNEEYGITFK